MSLHRTARLSNFAARSLFALVAVGLAACAAESGEETTADSDEALMPVGGAGGGGGGGVTKPPPKPTQVTCYKDADGDGYSGATSAVFSGSACPKGWTPYVNSDCNDANADVYPRWCGRDLDGDGFDGEGTVQMCVASSACAPAGDDCNDNDKTTFPKQCQWDRDGDGYAGPGGLICQGTCPALPSSVNAFYSDCNEGSAAVHPMRREVAGNGIDDDCYAGPDDAELVYRAGTGQAATTSLRVDMVLNDPSAIQVASIGTLYAQAVYASLNTSATTYRTPFAAVAPASSGTGISGSFTLAGLAPATVYSVYLLFASDPAGAHPLMTYSTDGNGNAVSTEQFVMATLSASSDAVEEVRPQMANRALGFWNGSQHGDFKEGLAACENCGGGNEWCSEFYNAVASPWFDSMLVTATTEATTSSIIGAFQDYGGVYRTNPTANIEDGYAEMGDYLGVGANGCATHSTMFLAWDPAQMQYWFVDGNDNDRVLFHAWHPNDATLNATLGHLTDAMLK